MNFIPSKGDYSKMEKISIAGIDVGSEELVCNWGKESRFQNSVKGIAKVVRQFSKLKIDLVVVEVTGGYERLLVEALWGAEIPVAVVNSERVRYFARAEGIVAKTDPIDARVIRIFGEKMKPRVTPQPPQYIRKLQYLLDRRTQLLQAIVAEKNRRRAPLSCQETRASIKRSLRFLSEELKKIEKSAHAVVQEHEDLKAYAEALEQENGCGPILTLTLLSEMPELGTLNRAKVGALVGVAPFNKDSAKMSGMRHPRGGRARVRTVLYMATVAAIRRNEKLKSFYLSLIKRGKKKMVALVATMRKFIIRLNSLVREARKKNQAMAFAMA